MSFKPGVFTSNAIATAADLELETAINKKLTQGRVVLWRERDAGQFSMAYTHRGVSKTFTRTTFELDTDEVAAGLMTTARGMQNTKLPHGWIYAEDDEPDNFEELIDGIE